MSYYLDGLRLTSPDPLASVRKMKGILEPLFYEEFLKYCQELASYLEEDRHLAWNEIPLFDLCSPCDDGEVLDERLRGGVEDFRETTSVAGSVISESSVRQISGTT